MNKRIIQLTVAVVLLAAILFAVFNRDAINVDLLEQWLEQAGWWAPIVFILLYISATVLFLPGSVFTLAGGIIFGPFLGLLYNLIGATIGASISFLIARYVASDFVTQHSDGRLKQLINGVEAEGWRFVAFVRLVPLFPFNLLNYALGLTRIRFSEYMLASFIFMMPGAAAYTYIGYAGRDAIAGGDGFIKNILIALALLAVAIFLPRFVATVRRGPSIDIDELKKRLDEESTVVLDVRSDKEFKTDGNIEGALNIPVDSLEQQISRLDQYKSQPISIVCRTDKRSAVAANVLLKYGFEDVRVVRGGMTDWKKQFVTF